MYIDRRTYCQQWKRKQNIILNSTRSHLILVLAASQLCQFFILVKNKQTGNYFHDSQFCIIRTRLTLKRIFFCFYRHDIILSGGICMNSIHPSSLDIAFVYNISHSFHSRIGFTCIGSSLYRHKHITPP